MQLAEVGRRGGLVADLDPFPLLGGDVGAGSDHALQGPLDVLGATAPDLEIGERPAPRRSSFVFQLRRRAGLPGPGVLAGRTRRRNLARLAPIRRGAGRSRPGTRRRSGATTCSGPARPATVQESSGRWTPTRPQARGSSRRRACTPPGRRGRGAWRSRRSRRSPGRPRP